MIEGRYTGTRIITALERNPFASNDVVETFSPTFTDRAEDLIGADELCIECPRLTLVVG
jgi:hypothetical protein